MKTETLYERLKRHRGSLTLLAIITNVDSQALPPRIMAVLKGTKEDAYITDIAEKLLCYLGRQNVDFSPERFNKALRMMNWCGIKLTINQDVKKQVNIEVKKQVNADPAKALDELNINLYRLKTELKNFKTNLTLELRNEIAELKKEKTTRGFSLRKLFGQNL